MPNISVSNLYVLMGMNYFKKFDGVLASVWKSYDREDFLKWEKSVDISKVASSAVQLEHIQKKLKVDISSQLKICQNTVCAKDLMNKQREIVNTLIRGMSTDARPEDVSKLEQDVSKLIKDNTNTSFGNRHEGSAIEKFEAETNLKVVNQQRRFNFEIGTYNGLDWKLVGLIDGMTATGEIVEIKNRVGSMPKNKALKNYETPQIMTYMWLAGAKTGYLAENYKISGSENLRIIPLKYKDDYFEKSVLPAIEKFIVFFNVFIGNDNMKSMLIKGDEENLYKIFLGC